MPEATGGRLKILFGILSLGTGGSERRCILLANEAVRRGHQVTIFTIRDDGFVAPLDPAIELRMIPRGGNPVGWFVRWRRAITELKPGVYHGFGALPGFPGAVAARRAGVPLVINALVTTPNYLAWWKRYPLSACFRFAHLGIANSTGVLNFHADAWGWPRRKLTVVGNPIELAGWPYRDAAARAEVRAELGLADDERAVVAVGRLFWYKGHKELLAAAARLQPEFPRTRWVIVGDGPLGDELEQQAADAGIADRVLFLGARSDVPRLLQGMDLFCLSSHLEGMSNALLEAMATGLPACSTRVSGSDDLLNETTTGWPLAEPANADSLAEALRQALAKRAEWPAYGEASRRWIEAHHTLDAVFDKLEGVYREWLGRG